MNQYSLYRLVFFIEYLVYITFSFGKRIAITSAYGMRNSNNRQCCCQDLFLGLETETETWTK